MPIPASLKRSIGPLLAVLAAAFLWSSCRNAGDTGVPQAGSGGPLPGRFPKIEVYRFTPPPAPPLERAVLSLPESDAPRRELRAYFPDSKRLQPVAIAGERLLPSPDLRRIAYSDAPPAGTKDEPNNIFVSDNRGKGATRVSREGFKRMRLSPKSWSSDSRWLLYAVETIDADRACDQGDDSDSTRADYERCIKEYSGPNPAEPGLYAADLTGGITYRLPAFDVFMDGVRLDWLNIDLVARFIPGTHRILMHSRRLHPKHLWIYGLDGDSLDKSVAVDEPDYYLSSVSTDCAVIRSPRSLGTYALKDSRRRQVADGDIRSAELSPDGQRLAFMKEVPGTPEEGLRYELFIFDLNTGGTRGLGRYELRDWLDDSRLVVVADSERRTSDLRRTQDLVLLSLAGGAEIVAGNETTNPMEGWFVRPQAAGENKQKRPVAATGGWHEAGALISKADVRSLAFGSEGSVLASGGEDGSLTLWNTKIRKAMSRAEAPGSAVMSVAVGPAGKIIATGSADGSVRTWDGLSAKPLLTMSLPGSAEAVAISPDGRWLSGAGSNSIVYIWDLAAGRRVSELNGHQDPVRSLAFNHAGTRLASGSGGAFDYTARIWDAGSWTLLKTIETGGITNSVAFSPDGKLLGAAGWDRIGLYSPENGELVRKMPWESKHTAVTSITFAPDGRELASGHEEGFVKLWDVAGGSLKGTLPAPGGQAKCLAYSPDGNALAVGGKDGVIRIWERDR